MKPIQTIESLKESGYLEAEIADMLGIQLVDVYSHLSGEKKYIPKPIDNIPKSSTESLKDEIIEAAKTAVNELKAKMKDADAQELSKLTDSVAKLYTALFKEDKGTQITIQQNNLSMFKNSLKN